MFRYSIKKTVKACLPAACLLALACLFAPTRAAAAGYTTSGNHILDPNGAVYYIHGVDRSGFESSSTGDGEFTQAQCNLIAGWKANTVRIAWNESYLLTDSSCYDANYLGRLDAAATMFNNAGLNVIFDLHWNTVNTTGCASGQQEMADRRSLTAWATMANHYKTWSKVFFELYNEPNTISWSQWLNGDGTWAGMQEMYNTVRGAGFNNLVLCGGLHWAYDLSGVASTPVSGVNIVYATHPYDYSGEQVADYHTNFGYLTSTYPVIATEFGDFTCTTGYVTSAMNYFDAPDGNANNKMSWTGWAWNGPGSCSWPSIINDWNGTPSTMGQPEHDRLASYVTVPSAPTNLTATGGPGQIALTWNASSGATTYNVKRSTVNGSGYATISSPGGVSYTDTSVVTGTTYYYVVSAVNSAGESANSTQASGTPTAATLPIQINSAGPAVSPFVADEFFSAGTTATNWTGAIDTSAVTNPAPQAVYQSERWGANTYTIGGLASGTSYTVRLHFCENYWSASGERVFNVSINGTPVLTNYDIIATTGAQHKANIQQFSTTGNSSGQIVIVYTNVTDNALSNGIEILAASTAPAAPTGLTAIAGNSQVALSWTASSGATSYNALQSTVSGSGYMSVATGISVTNYTNTGLTNGTTYYFVVTATNAFGTSGNSNQAGATPEPAAPAAPANLAATGGNAQVSLTWTASSGATSYNVLRSTVSGSGYASVATGISTTSYTNTGLTNGTTYYFVVTATNAGGTSGNSNQASATPTAPATLPVQINCAGPAVSPFIADVEFSGGTPATNWTGAIDTSAVTNPAPQAVYQSERYGAMTYTIGGLTANTTYTVRLHMCENYFTASGQRTFTVAINGTTELTNFDIYATTGAIHKATCQQFNVAANSSGQEVIVFTNVVNNALIDGIEVTAAGGSAPAAPANLAATAGSAQVGLTWTASSGATSYNALRSTVSGSGYASVATGISATSYTNTGLANGTTYYFVVTATNANGTSGNSNQASATPISPNVHGGTWSCKAVMTTTPSYTNAWETVTVPTNQTYVASVWIKGSGAVLLKVLNGNWGTEITGEVRCNATSTWQQYSTAAFNTGTNTQLTYVLQDQYGVAGTAYLDDTFQGVSSGANTLLNPGFESGNVDWGLPSGAFSIVQNP